MSPRILDFYCPRCPSLAPKSTHLCTMNRLRLRCQILPQLWAHYDTVVLPISFHILMIMSANLYNTMLSKWTDYKYSARYDHKYFYGEYQNTNWAFSNFSLRSIMFDLTFLLHSINRQPPLQAQALVRWAPEETDLVVLISFPCRPWLLIQFAINLYM